MFKIGNLEIRGALLAPMAGLTDVGFRDVAALCGAGVTYTEMVSAKGMVYGNEKTKELLATTDTERIKAVQIFGADPSIMSDCVKMADLDKFDIIDINMGCPVNKIVKNGEGSALLNSPNKAYDIVKAVVTSTTKPVTVKMRIGFRYNEFTAPELALAVEEAGAAAITVHGRTREQFYAGKADWRAIADTALRVSIPVIANGDVSDCESYNSILEKTGASGVMIGRAALGNPAIFSAIRDIEEDEEYLSDIDILADPKYLIMRQIETLKRFYSDKYIYSNMKKHICYYLKGFSGVRTLKDRICRAESMEELTAEIANIDFK